MRAPLFLLFLLVVSLFATHQGVAQDAGNEGQALEQRVEELSRRAEALRQQQEAWEKLPRAAPPRPLARDETSDFLLGFLALERELVSLRADVQQQLRVLVEIRQLLKKATEKGEGR